MYLVYILNHNKIIVNNKVLIIINCLFIDLCKVMLHEWTILSVGNGIKPMKR